LVALERKEVKEQAAESSWIFPSPLLDPLKQQTKERKMKTQDIVKSLKHYGIRARGYVRPPIGEDVFALTIVPRHKEGVVLVNHGAAKIDICGSKRLRQATMTVREKGREVTRVVKDRVWNDSEPTQAFIMERLKRHFPVIMPKEAEWTVTNIKCERLGANIRRPGVNKYYLIQGKVTAIVKDPTTNHFLLGMDETRNFICPISGPVKSVRGAHRRLRPEEVTKGSLRQGEWFFIPCTAKTLNWLNKLATRESGRIRCMQLGETTHVAKSAITVSKGTYARGYITDRRTGHHRSLFLPKWHKVVRNKEAEIKVAAFQKDALKRRRHTWD
jgi:hypothetical protein